MCEYFSKNNPIINFSGTQAYGIENNTSFSLYDCDCNCLKKTIWLNIVFFKKQKKPSNLATTYSPRFTNQVPLAMTRFTLEFGMGSGGSTSL